MDGDDKVMRRYVRIERRVEMRGWVRIERWKVMRRWMVLRSRVSGDEEVVGVKTTRWVKIRGKWRQ